MTDGITNLSEIDWNHVDMHPCQGMEGYEPRPEYSEIVQERKRNKAVIGLQFFRAALRLFLVIGAVVLMKVIVDYAKDIRNGVIEPPAPNELGYLFYLVLGIVLMIVILNLVKRLRQTKYEHGHPINTAPRRESSIVSIWAQLRTRVIVYQPRIVGLWHGRGRPTRLISYLLMP